METLHFDFITKEWCEKNKTSFPVDFIEEVKNKVTVEYEKQEMEQELSLPKIDNFYKSAKEIIPKVFQLYQPLNNEIKINDNYNQLFIVGERAVVDKSSFALDQESEHLNYDSFLPEAISNKIHRGMSEIIYSMKTKTYLFQPKDLFNAIDKLEVNSEAYLILNFGNYLPYFIDELKIPELSLNRYRKTDIINLAQFHFQLIGESFFIIKRSDLPNIEYLDIENNEIDKYKLELLDNYFKFYGSVLDLFKNKDLQKDFSGSSNETNLDKSVLVSICLSTRIRWAKTINLIQIKSYSGYRDKGSTNDLKEIIPIK
jgi:hypothetical protein